MTEKDDKEPFREGDTEPPELLYELKSAHEAARILRVSESTVWRYAAQDLLPSYRVGRKRVMFRRSDLEALLKRVRRRKGTMTTDKKLRLFAMSEGARASGDAMTRATEVRERILAGRGGVPVTESWEDINAAREERTAEL